MRVILLNGCRINEALQLRWQALKLAGEGLYIQRGIIAKGGIAINLKLTKSILSEIEEYWDRIYLGAGHEYLFRINRVAASKRVSRAIMNTLHISASAHSLRHSFASLALENGISLMEVASRLNHKSPKTTAQYYLHGGTTKAGDEFAQKLASNK